MFVFEEVATHEVVLCPASPRSPRSNTASLRKAEIGCKRLDAARLSIEPPYRTQVRRKTKGMF